MMKRGSLLAWLVPLAIAAPLLEQRHGESARYIPNYPGIQFNSDGKLSISVFSDLHFGERKFLPQLRWVLSVC
tara:strand:- start:4235 stop:4453 length:219 start_codon:yes stop_codon:yes gene_type:complete